jgi:hypothetical protein
MHEAREGIVEAERGSISNGARSRLSGASRTESGGTSARRRDTAANQTRQIAAASIVSAMKLSRACRYSGFRSDQGDRRRRDGQEGAVARVQRITVGGSFQATN